jgi:dTDP-4-amino-4,6-dideoxygalactose transaminase
MKVPFLDLKAHNDQHRSEFEKAIGKVLDSGIFTGGPFVEEFEGKFADYCGTAHAVGVGSGTDALWVALMAMGVGHGDEVITMPGTFFATVEAIILCGAKTVFVDVDPHSYGMNPDLLEAAITPRTKAIVPVHMFGLVGGMDRILEIASKNGIPVVEDSAQAHGARYNGRRAGSLGVAGCFSFYPGKNLGAFGEAGAVVTHDAALAEKMRMLRDHGQRAKYYHEILGGNCRMDAIQGAVLLVNLPYLEDRNRLRLRWAQFYSHALGGVPGMILPQTPAGEDTEHIYHIYAVRVPERDRILADMGAAGIVCGIHYPIPLHLQAACKNMGYSEGSFPVAEQCAKEFLSLPMYAELTKDQVIYTVETLKRSMPPAGFREAGSVFRP